MDLVADMLFDRLQREQGTSIAPTLVRPSMRRRVTRLPGGSGMPWLPMIDRVANRMWDYPRIVATLGDFDLYHIVDHSYAHLVHRLPAGRTIVTCHDLDTFRSVLDPALEPRSAPFRAMTRRILDGVRNAGHVACDSAATRDALVTKAGVRPERTSIVHNGPHPSCSPHAEPAADFDAARLLGPRGSFTDLLHVGSTIPRKRIDVLLRVFESLRGVHRRLRLVRVGGPLTAAQRALARELDVADALVEMPTLDRSTLAAVYRRCALLLMPSEREGFGLPGPRGPRVRHAGRRQRHRRVEGGRGVRRRVLPGSGHRGVAANGIAPDRRTESSRRAVEAAPGSRHPARSGFQLVPVRARDLRCLRADGARRQVLKVLHVGKFYPPLRSIGVPDQAAR